jgi:hypothetical protein
MPAKIARSAPRPPFGLPELTVAVRTSLLSCWKAGKTRVFATVLEASGEARLRCLRDIATRNIFGLAAFPLAAGMMVYLMCQGAPLQPPGIVGLELAFTEGHATKIVGDWAGKLDIAVKQVLFDFIFIAGYTGSLLFACFKAADCAAQRGRASLAKAAEAAGYGALLAGTLDCVENFGLLLTLNWKVLAPIVLITSVSASLKFALVVIAALVALATFRLSWRPAAK